MFRAPTAERPDSASIFASGGFFSTETFNLQL